MTETEFPFGTKVRDLAPGGGFGEGYVTATITDWNHAEPEHPLCTLYEISYIEGTQYRSQCRVHAGRLEKIEEEDPS